MSPHLTGDSIKALRTSVGLSATHFSALIGTHYSTLCRWEQLGCERVNANPLSRRLLLLLHEIIKEKTEGQKLAYGATLLEAMFIRGNLYALYKLLKSYYT